MRFKMPAIRRRVSCLAGTGALVLAGVGGLAVSEAGHASAATCTPGVDCTITRTATLGTGTLSLTTPASLAWATTLTGAAQQLVDTSTAECHRGCRTAWPRSRCWLRSRCRPR
jgi:hypothetical protein